MDVYFVLISWLTVFLVVVALYLTKKINSLRNGIKFNHYHVEALIVILQKNKLATSDEIDEALNSMREFHRDDNYW